MVLGIEECILIMTFVTAAWYNQVEINRVTRIHRALAEFTGWWTLSDDT